MLTRMQGADAEGVAGTSERRDRGLRNPVEPPLIILEQLGEGASRVKMKATLGLTRDGIIFILDGLTQLCDIGQWLPNTLCTHMVSSSVNAHHSQEHEGD